ncbi:MAG: zf-HC2 domain-containing protein [Polyangiaceae bacterium]|jgi:anti-sigma factor RsiW|nr:zf-HC2 domain-containing protein [Polyangiaceae bacterium]
MKTPSTTSSAPNSCRRLAPAVTIFVDGELEPSQAVEVEAHLADCGRCHERVALDQAVRASLRALPRPTASDALRRRVAASMAAERQTSDEFASDGAELSTLPRAPYKYMAPLAMAAGFALMLTAHNSSSPTAAPAARGQAPSTANASVAAMGLDSLVEELVQQHAEPLPPEVTRQDDVRAFDPFVGVPVEAPKFTGFGAKFYGGRMLPVRDHRAAMLQYKMAGGHRVTVYVYDPRRVQPEQRWLRERTTTTASNAPVYVGSMRGFNVAATERRGVGYAIATDLGEREIVELANEAPGSL